MDAKKSKQEQLFLKSREICEDTHIETANALDMSQYSILGDETYTLDYISKIDMSTPRGNIEDNEFYKRYKALYTGPRRGLMAVNLMYLYLRVKVEHDSNSVEPFMSYEEYAYIIPVYIKDIVDTTIVGLKRMTEIYNKSLPIKNKFVFSLPDDKYLILIRGKLLLFTLIHIKEAVTRLFSFINKSINSIIEIQNIKQLREKIKIKRIKKR